MFLENVRKKISIQIIGLKPEFRLACSHEDEYYNTE
jgi:hypothetical protein